MKTMLAAACAAALVAGCNDQPATPAATDAATDTAAATRSPIPTDWNRAALGLREEQLLNADLLGIDGGEFGSINGLVTDTDGRVVRLLVEVEDSEPERFVHVPVEGLTVLTRGSDIDIVSTMTLAQLAALPNAPTPIAIPAPTPVPTAT